LIFFVTFLHQGKKVKALYSKGNFKPKYLNFILLKSKTNFKDINHITDYLEIHLD